MVIQASDEHKDAVIGTLSATVEKLRAEVQYLKTVNADTGTLMEQVRATCNGLAFNTYQQRAGITALYPREQALEYVTLGLVGEAGEMANKVKKILRGDYTQADVAQALRDELGDVLWYAAMIATELNVLLADVAQENLDKLASRSKRGVIAGSGDNR